MDWNDKISIASEALRNAQSHSIDCLIEDQRRLSDQLILEALPIDRVKKIVGLDVQYTDREACAAAVVLDRITLETLQVVAARSEYQMEYEFGFLAYRELPSMLDALATLEERPDLIFYDGNGTLHPRGFGAACHLGVLLDVPIIGVSKNVSSYRPFAEKYRGETRELDAGRGCLLVTRDETKPVCVSPGHRVDFSSAIELVLAVSKSRIPEPIRLADRAARMASLEKP